MYAPSHGDPTAQAAARERAYTDAGSNVEGYSDERNRKAPNSNSREFHVDSVCDVYRSRCVVAGSDVINASASAIDSSWYDGIAVWLAGLLDSLTDARCLQNYSHSKDIC